jgi:hypothetical protein
MMSFPECVAGGWGPGSGDRHDPDEGVMTSSSACPAGGFG